MDELFTKLPNLKQNINLTKDTLNNFYKSLQEKKDKITHTCTPITFLGKYPHSLKIPPTDFIESELYNSLEESNGFYQQFNMKISHRQFVIHLYLPSENSNSRDNNVADFFQDCIHKIHLWLSFISPYILNECSMKTNIYLLFTRFKKVIPYKGEDITFKHVNSAFTTACSPQSSIYIFRYEEWFKVLIHESFHCFGLDFSHHDNYEAEREITKAFKVKNKNGVRVYEAYCEIWAEVLNIVLVSYLKTKDKKSFMILFEHLLNKELSFTLFQCNKILQHRGILYNNIIDMNSKHVTYEETTNITSYYFLKMILFLNLRKFESWCKKHNNLLFQFEKKNILKFVDFLSQHSNTSPLQQCLRRMNTFYKRVDLLPFAEKTMRMTIVKG